MDELLREFLTETSESLDVADVELVKFESEPNNLQILNNIFRLVHTIKGTCGFIGLPRLAMLAHAAEAVMDKFRQGRPVTADAVSLILRTIDRIKSILTEIEAAQGKEPAGSDRDLIEQLEAIAAATARSPAASPAPADTPASVPPPSPAPAAATARPASASRGSVGTPVAQTLERPLMPGEVSLDELERAFRETEVEALPAATPTDAVAPAESKSVTPVPAASARAGAGPADDNHAGVAAQSIRVNVDALDHLMTMISELVLTRNQLVEIARRQEDPEYKVSLQRLSTVTAELQEAVMRTRMQPIGNAWQKLPRIVRDLAKDLGKQIELDMVGADTELDRQVLDLIKDPLTHMVRNSADHGLEMPEERRRVGKSEKGLIRLSAYHEGGHIIIEIADDGKGLDTDKIRAKALEKRIASEAELAKMSDAQIFRFIFHAGFSTAEKVTSVSGRGVGMDVVRTNIDLIGGSVDVRSKRGQGSTFTIKIPLTLAIVPALIVESAGERFAIPQLAVVELVRIQANSETRIERIKGAPVLRLRDELLPIVLLSRLLGVKHDADEEKVEEGFIAVMQVGHQTFGIVVDAVFHTEEIVIKPMSSMLRQIPMFSGSTILGDGRVILIIDPNGIAQAAAGSLDPAGVDTGTEREARGEDSAAAISLLLFRAGSEEPKAEPLSLVTRLEEIELTKIEHAGGRSVVLYRGSLIPLVHVHESVDRTKGKTQPMLVFSENGRTMGLLVDEIVDIVEDRLKIELPSEVPGFLGAAIIGERATEVLDISHFLALAFHDWFERKPESRAGHRGRLLLIDDSAFFRDLIHPVLSGVGYHVVACGSLAEAREHLAGDDGFDAVVADIDMAEMKPAAFVASVHGDARHRDVPVIAMSGSRSNDAMSRSVAAGFSDHVAKSDRGGLIAALTRIPLAMRGEAA